MSAAPDIRDVRRRLGVAVQTPVAKVCRPGPPKRDFLDVATQPEETFVVFGLPPMPPRVRDIIREVLSEYRMQWRWVVSQRRSSELVDVRRKIATRLRKELSLTMTQIGGYLKRDHSSVCNLINNRPRDQFMLSREAVLHIRNGNDKQVDLRKMYNISERTIRSIRNGEQYGFVE